MLGMMLCIPNAFATSTTNLLITDGNNHRVIEVDPITHNVIWQYGQSGVIGSGTNQLNYSSDAAKLMNGNVLITDTYNHRIIEVRPTGISGGTIVWQYGQTGVRGSEVNQLGFPCEAIRLANGNTMIADSGNHRVIEVKTTDYLNFTASSIIWQQGQTGVYGSGWNQLYSPRDVEEIRQGILNQAIVEYNDMAGVPQPIVTAWVFTPVIPAVVSPPVLTVTKTVSPAGTQSSGTVLTYTIAYNNTGAGTATSAVFTDVAPAGTVYGTGTAVVASGPSGAITYSHDAGTTYNGSDTAPVTHVRWTIPAIGPGESGVLRFSVTIR